MTTFRPTHVVTGHPGYAHHVPVRVVPLPEFEPVSVDSRGPLLVVTPDGTDLMVVPASRVQPSVSTTVRRITDCDTCADTLTRSLRCNSLRHLRTYFRMTRAYQEVHGA
jgi:hypothetical protein